MKNRVHLSCTSVFWFLVTIRWPAKDMRRADAKVEEAATAAVQSQAAVEATVQSPVKKQKAKEVTKKTTSKKLVPDKAEVSPLTQ